ncbi:MAG: hypothetical protein ACYC6F_18360 [Longimicrobiales bacterium]
MTAMRRNWRRIRQALGAPISALVLFAGGAGPLLDAADLLADSRLMSSDEPASGGSGHDHRLCIQIRANQATPSHQSPCPAAWTTLARVPSIPVPAGLLSRAHEASAPARAPPSR